MKKRRMIFGSLGFLALMGILAVATTGLWTNEAGAGVECDVVTVFGYGEGATCKEARKACRQDAKSHQQNACTGVFFTGEICWVGTFSHSACADTDGDGDKDVTCQRDVCCETTSPF